MIRKFILGEGRILSYEEFKDYLLNKTLIYEKFKNWLESKDPTELVGTSRCEYFCPVSSYLKSDDVVCCVTYNIRKKEAIINMNGELFTEFETWLFPFLIYVDDKGEDVLVTASECLEILNRVMSELEEVKRNEQVFN